MPLIAYIRNLPFAGASSLSVMVWLQVLLLKELETSARGSEDLRQSLEMGSAYSQDS